MGQPSSLSSADAAALIAEFGTDGALELTLDVMKWNYQKVPVALGTDAEVRSGQLTDLAFDADGNAIIA